MTILMRRACRDGNDWTKKPILYSLVSLSASNYQLHTPSFLAVARAPDLHSGVCYFIEFDARYLVSSSVRFLGDLVWSAASFLGTIVLQLCI